MPVAGSVSWVNFNPHSPCGERRGFRRQRLAVHISIHTPLAGSDWLIVSWSVTVRVFQSTLPLRGATFRHYRIPTQINFNPHSPCGERPQK